MKTTITLAVVVAVVASLAAGTSWARTQTTHVGVTAAKPGEFGYTLTTKTVKIGTVIFSVKNGSAALSHDFKVCSKPVATSKANTCTGKGTKLITPGKSTTLSVTFTKKGKYEYLCTVPGHAAGGMKGLITVT